MTQRIAPKLYDRDRGAVALAVPLLHRMSNPFDVVARLRSSGLTWCWESESGDAALTDDRRPSTRLTLESEPHLITDLTERDGDGYNRFVAIAGLIADVPCSQLSKEFTAFDRGNASAVCCVLVQVGDAEEELIYVPQPKSAAVERLLSKLGIDQSAAQIHPYSELRKLSFASLFAPGRTR